MEESPLEVQEVAAEIHLKLAAYSSQKLEEEGAGCHS